MASCHPLALQTPYKRRRTQCTWISLGKTHSVHLHQGLNH